MGRRHVSAGKERGRLKEQTCLGQELSGKGRDQGGSDIGWNVCVVSIWICGLFEQTQLNEFEDWLCKPEEELALPLRLEGDPRTLKKQLSEIKVLPVVKVSVDIVY